MRALIASLLLVLIACGGKTTTTTTDRVETTDGNGTTTTTLPDKDPDVDLQPKADITLAEAEATVTRIVELMAELVDALQGIEDCTQLVPAYLEWETKNADEQAQLEETGSKIPGKWANGELVDYFLKMEEHGKSMQIAVGDCRCDASVQAQWGFPPPEDCQ